MNLFPVILFAFFTLWCYGGLVWLETPREWRFVRAVLFGFVRSVLLIGFRFLIFYISLPLGGLGLNPSTEQWIAYIILYIPSVWIEWCLMTLFMTGRWAGFSNFLAGPWKPTVQWKLMGAVVTIVMELPRTFLWQSLLRILANHDGGSL